MADKRGGRAEIDKKIEYFEELKSKRNKWDSIWDELSRYVTPQTKSTKEIFDSTSIWSREQLASGLQSLLVNPSLEWFKVNLLGASGELEKESTVKLWAEQVEGQLFAIFNNPSSNFYNQVHEFFLNLTAYGTGIFYIEEDIGKAQGIFFRNISLRQCYFTEDRFGFVSSMYRLFEMPVRLAASKWPEAKLFREKLEKAPDELIEILHIVEAIEDTKGNKSGGGRQYNTSQQYSSKYIYLDNRQLIAESGYSYFPFLVCRWIKEEGESYGYAPAHHVLPDIKLLNSLRQITLKTAQKQLDPPLLVPKDGYYLPLYTTPGSVNFYRGGIADKIVPLTGIENTVPTEIEQNHCRDAIFKAFYVDIFRSYSSGVQKGNKEMTATEVQARSDEQMRMMAPMMGRIETEFLNPLITAMYQILVKYNLIPELELGRLSSDIAVPDKIEIEYISPLARAQKSSSIAAIESVIGFFQRSGLINLFPDIYDNMDFDKILRKFIDLRGCPQDIVRDDMEVTQVRRQRQVMQMNQMNQMQGDGMPEGQ